jgi:2-polyprenyl-6-methoxyphenol hydroxylase-like FAD-dependent oxidoreductase
MMKSKHAMVIGGSIAGLCAGRVLSDFFEHVTVIDRDSYPTGVQERAGVPQSRHVHALLARGRQELERLFPGFDRLMSERGAQNLDFGLDFAALRVTGWAHRETEGFRLLFASRSLLEATVRELFRQLPNVTLQERATVTGLIANRDTSTLRVTGAHVTPLDAGNPSDMSADLIIDASGRASKAPDWLQALGLESPEESVVNGHAGYSSRWFQAPESDRWPRDWWWKGIWLDIKEPDHMMAGVLFPLEQGRWIVTLGGMAKHYPPTDEEGFMHALSTLRSPILAEAVRLATPLSPVYSNRAMANRMRHYDRWRERLDGFIALGDSVCAFNPVYGQGMTTSAVSASILADCLRKYGLTHPDFAQRFFQTQAQFQESPWRMATGADFRYPETEGVRPQGARLFDPYMNALFAAAAQDNVVRQRLVAVIHMLKTPSALFTPMVASRVALATARTWLTKSARTAPESAMPPVLMPVG